ncbi:MAG: hypothetical protein QXO98_02825 [Sulfolobales archaeon]
MGKGYVTLKDGYQLIMELFLPYRRRIYEYNSLIKDTGYYLKPLHLIVKKDSNLKYLYFGRYWYRITKGSHGKIKWIYIGREKPDPSLPEPPINPFEGLKIIASNNDVMIDEYVYRILNNIINRKDLLKSNY